MFHMVNSVHMVFTCCSHAFHRACPSSDNEDLVEVHDRTTEYPKRAPSSLSICALVLDATFNNRNLKTLA